MTSYSNPELVMALAILKNIFVVAHILEQARWSHPSAATTNITEPMTDMNSKFTSISATELPKSHLFYGHNSNSEAEMVVFYSALFLPRLIKHNGKFAGLRWCQGLFRPQVPCTPAYTVQLLTLHQHRANNQYRTANQI